MASEVSPIIQQLVDEDKLLLIDKPAGKTSHDIVNQVRRQTGVKRVGHAGTLDPLATGLLLVLVGREATRHQDELMGLDKEYLFTAALGYETDTYDSDGVITQTWPWEQVRSLTRQSVELAAQQFVGEYDQQVPAFSAVKQHGQKLYQLARKHQEIELPVRRVQIHELEVTSFSVDQTQQTAQFSARVGCGSGTYIRSLAVDIGRKLGVGATVTALRRTKIGPFALQEY